MDTKTFIKKSKLIHGNKYDYSLSKYESATKKIKIICPKHKLFKQGPYGHLSGKGCPKCANNIRLQKNEFIEKSKLIHGNKYDYSAVVYKNNKTKVRVKCPKHSYFFISPGNHYGKKAQGCPKCSLENKKLKSRLTQEIFIKRAKKDHENFYDYSEVKYKKMTSKIKIICPLHGPFMQRAGNHLSPSKNGCTECNLEIRNNKLRLKKKEFFQKLSAEQKNKYDYSKVNYKNYKTPVKVFCPEHGYFMQTPAVIFRGGGCNRCYNKSEGRIAKYLEKKCVVHRRHYIKNKEFDFYLPDLNILIERDGEQHYGNNRASKFMGDQRENDILKTKLAKEYGYKISRIPFWLDHDQEEKEIENILKGEPSYPDIPDINQLKTKPSPK